MDQKTRDLARAIYEQHEEVIRVIWQAGADEDEGTAIAGASREWYENSRFFIEKDRLAGRLEDEVQVYAAAA